MADNALLLTTIAVDVSTGVAQLKKFEQVVTDLSKKVDAQVKKMDELGGGGKAKKGLEDVGQSATGLTSIMGKLGLSWGSVIGIGSAAAGALAIKSFFTTSIAAAIEAEAATEELSSALKAQGADVDSSLPHLLRYATALSQVTVQTDEAIQGVQKTLIAIGGLSGGALDKATKATLDLAKGMGIGIDGAARMMAKAAEGVVTPFTRYGLVVNKSADDTEKFAAVLDFVQKKFGGMAASELNTVHGSLARLKDDWSELKESMGTAILKATDATSVFTALSATLQALNTQINNPEAMGFWKSIGILMAGAAGGAAGFASASTLVENNARVANLTIADQGEQLDSAVQSWEAYKKTQTEVMASIRDTAGATRKAQQEVEILKEALKSADGVELTAIQKRIGELSASIRAAAGEGANAFKGDLLQSKAKAAEPGSSGASTAALEAFDFEAKQKLQIAAESGRAIANLEAALAIERQSMVDRFHQAVLDKEQSFQQRLLDIKVAAAPAGSREQLDAQLAAFDERVNAEYEREAKGKADTAALVEGFAADRARIEKQGANALIAIEQSLQERLLSLRVSAASKGAQSDLDASLALYDFKANAEYERVSESHGDLAALTEILIEGRVQAEKAGLDKIYAETASSEEALTQLRLDAAASREEELATQASDAWGVSSSGALGAFLDMLTSIVRLQQDNSAQRIAAMQETNAAQLELFDQQVNDEYARMTVSEDAKTEYIRQSLQKREMLERNLATRVIEFSKMTQRQKMNEASAILASVGAVVTAVFGKTKAGQYAATVINTASAVMNAMANLPYPANIVAAVATGVMGAVQLSKIKSSTLEGGGGSASVSAPSVPAVDYGSAKGQGAGPNSVTGTSALLVGAPSDTTAKGAMGGGVTINVKLHALDEKSVREYLTSPEIRRHVAEAYNLQTSRA